MPRKPRPVPLTAAEIGFRMGAWVERNLTIIERHGPEWVTVCPSCGRSKMAIHIGRKAFQCLSAHCRFSGWSPTRLVAVTLDMTRSQAEELIAATGMGVTIGPVPALEIGQQRSRTAEQLPGASLPLVDWRLQQAQHDYMIGRGAPEEHMRLFGLGTILSNGSGSKADYALSGRVIFPAWNPIGRMVWWVARTIHPSRAKTINMPRSCREDQHEVGCVCYHEAWGLPPVVDAATADEVVLGLHLVRAGEPVIVVEGPVDAVVCGPGFVSTQRAWISAQQAALIANSGASEAIILFDGDRADEQGRRAGEEGLIRSMPILSAALPTRGLTCPEGEDPASLGRRHALAIAYAAPRGGIQQLRNARYMMVVPRPLNRPPIQEPLTSHDRVKKEK